MGAVGRATGWCLLGMCGALAACDGSPGAGASDATSEQASTDDSGGGDAPGDDALDDATADTGGPADAGGSADGSGDVGVDQSLDAGPDVEGAADGSFDATVTDATEAGDAPAEAAPEASVDAALDATLDGAPDASEAGSAADASDASEDALDASPEEAGETYPPSQCSTQPYLFCDGFEQSLLTNWAAIATSGAQVGIDSAHVYRGQHALHANTYAILEAGVSEYAYVQKYGASPWPTHFFTRLFAYMPSPAPTFAFNFLDLQQNGGSYGAVELRVNPNDLLAMLTFLTPADQQWGSADAGFPFDQWTCFEVEVDTTAETENVYVNDTAVPDLGRGNLALQQLGNVTVGLGFAGANPQGAYDLWIDEVAVNSARIGCAN